MGAEGAVHRQREPDLRGGVGPGFGRRGRCSWHLVTLPAGIGSVYPLPVRQAGQWSVASWMARWGRAMGTCRPTMARWPAGVKQALWAWRGQHTGAQGAASASCLAVLGPKTGPAGEPSGLFHPGEAGVALGFEAVSAGGLGPPRPDGGGKPSHLELQRTQTASQWEGPKSRQNLSSIL